MLANDHLFTCLPRPMEENLCYVLFAVWVFKKATLQRMHKTMGYKNVKVDGSYNT